MKILGIDYGERKVGVAVGDDQLWIATPKTIIPNAGRVALRDAILKVIKQTDAEHIVIGLPLSFKMQETDFSRKVRSFGEWFREEVKIPVEFENEILSSSLAERLYAGESNRASDAVAAALILQSWLDRRNNKLQAP